jgi:hypothetical protein
MKQKPKKSIVDNMAFTNLKEDNMTEKQFKEYMELYKERNDALIEVVTVLADKLNSISDIGHEMGKLQANVGYLCDRIANLANR